MEKNLIEGVKKNIKYWWIYPLVGILAIAVGILSYLQPLVTVGILSIFFIANFLISGIFEIAFAVSNKTTLDNWGWILTGGIINIIFAIILLALPPAGNILVFIYYISFYVLLQAMMGIWGSIGLKKLQFNDWWMYLILAILGLILALILIFSPAFAIGFITIIFSATLICYGLFRIFYGFKLKKIKNAID